MRKGSISIIKIILAVILLFPSFGMTCQAEEVYRNPDTGYAVVVEDKYEFLSETKKAEIVEIMKEISAYGNVMCWIGQQRKDNLNFMAYAEEYYLGFLGDTKGIILFIDTRYGELYLYSHAEMYNVITNSLAKTILNNGYRYSKKQLYGLGAVEVYKQILSILKEQSISQPLKIVSGILFGLFLGCFLTYVWAMRWYKKHIPQPVEKEELFMSDIRFVNMHVSGETMEKTYYPLGIFFRPYPKEVDNKNYNDSLKRSSRFRR